MKIIVLLIICINFIFVSTALADEDETDERHKVYNFNILNNKKSTLINDNYKQRVRPIFKTKCFDCHIVEPDYPWYVAIPGLGHLMKHHNKKGVEDLDLSNDFPFKSKEGLFEILEELQEEVLDENEMPPVYYLITHWNASLTSEEKTIIQSWLNETLVTIKQ